MAKEKLTEKIKKRKEELKARLSAGDIIFIKPDTTLRIRLLNMGEEEEFVKEVIQFYLGGDIKGIISPATYDQPCKIMEGYNELKEGDDEEKAIAKKFIPRRKYLTLCALYKDEKGKELDEGNSPKLILLGAKAYQDILDLFLDVNEWGDMTDPEEGYDLKYSREGSGKTDTVYSIKPCKNTQAPRKFRNKIFNLDEEVKKVIPSYEQTGEYLNDFLGLDEEEDEKPKKKKLGKKKLKKNLNNNGDLPF